MFEKHGVIQNWLIFGRERKASKGRCTFSLERRGPAGGRSSSCVCTDICYCIRILFCFGGRGMGGVERLDHRQVICLASFCRCLWLDEVLFCRPFYDLLSKGEMGWDELCPWCLVSGI